MYNLILPTFILLTNWTIPGFISKYYLLNNLSPFEITINNWIIGGIIGIILLLLLPNTNKYFANKGLMNENLFNYNFKKNYKYFFIFFGLMLFGILSSISYYYLLNKSDVRKITSYLNPINIILIALISNFIFKEYISFGSSIGILIIVIGLIIMYYFEN